MSLTSNNRSTLFPLAPNPAKQSPAWVEINVANFKANVKIIRSILKPGVKLGAMTKGNAYGLGFEEYVMMSHADVDIFYVKSIRGASRIRELEKTNNLLPKRIILGETHHTLSIKDVIACVAAGVEIIIDSSLHHELFLSAALDEVAIPIKVIIFIDTGMNREGFRLRDLEQVLNEINKYQHRLDIIGIMTHFRAGDNAASNQQQLEELNQVHELIKQKLKLQKPLEKSIANSSAALSFPEMEQDIVRMGYALIHGLWPSNKTKLNVATHTQEEIVLHPTLSWKCKVKRIRRCGAGVELVTEEGYGHSLRLKQPTMTATFACGAAMGYPTYHGGTDDGPYVLIKGQKCKVLLVELTEIVVDVTNIAVPGEKITATLIGCDGNEHLSAQTVASWIGGREAYELLTRINDTIPRLTVNAAPLNEEKQDLSLDIEYASPRP